MYLSGRGVKKNRETAIGWLKKAAAGGDEAAKAKLKALGVES
jgi:TPR repeat protein